MIQAHLENLDELSQGSPPESRHALGIEQLKAPEVTLWGAWEGDLLIGCVALKALSPEHGEIKSMRTAPEHLRRGIASLLLRHVIDQAQARHYHRLSLETGSQPGFSAARAFYLRHGFSTCAPFDNYVEDPNSVYMTMYLNKRHEQGHLHTLKTVGHSAGGSDDGTQLPLPQGAVEIAFSSAGTICRGWHFPPVEFATQKDAMDSPAPATLVMAPGLGGIIDGGLSGYASRLSQAGYRVVGFDYRYFGRSNGKPRQLLTIHDQLKDWAAAIAFAQHLAPASPLVLWGTSFSSAHVMTLAARRHDVAAVIAQNPMLDGMASVLAKLKHNGPGSILKLSQVAIEDWLRGRVGMQPRYIPIAAEPGQLAALDTDDALEGITSLVPETFDNRMSARVLLTLGLYRPIRKVHRIRCPVLLQLCRRDTVTPIAPGYRAATLLGSRATLSTYDAGHFDIYEGDLLDAVVSDQIAFLDRVLTRARLPASASLSPAE
uniref:GNAT family N-acetyltransferase n=1 Tax=Halomonas sp. TaxID=1486246 RepID=UPI00261EF612|nr:GNAT family N-acetyltransferase [Halomonas sp.]